jgi:FkbM family methyltransferase
MSTIYESLRESLLKLGPTSPVLRSAIRLQAGANGISLADSKGKLTLTKRNQCMLLPSGQYLMIPYAVHMWEQLFDTVIPGREGDRAVLDFSTPGVHEYSKSGLSLWAPGMVEEDSMDAYTAEHVPAQGEVIWDVGAHGGFTSYYFSKMVGPAGKVYAFEPDDHAYTYLMRNIEMHKLENVIPVKKALANSTGTALFCMDGSLGAGLTDYTHTADKSNMREVETISPSDAFRNFGPPAFIKMDIEGAEVAVVSDALTVLKDHPVHFAIETEHRVQREYTSVPITRMLSSIGYKVWSSRQFGGQQFTWAAPGNA